MKVKLTLSLHLNKHDLWRHGGTARMTEKSGFDSRQGQQLLLFSPVSRPALGPVQPTTQSIMDVPSQGVKAAGTCSSLLTSM
jgi:hypothetical protein